MIMLSVTVKCSNIKYIYCHYLYAAHIYLVPMQLTL